MNIVEIKQAFQKALPEGFELSITSEGMAIFAWKKNENQVIQTLILANLQFSKIEHLTCYNAIGQIEEIFNPKGNPCDAKTIDLKNHCALFNIAPLIGIKEYFPLDLSDSSNLPRATELIAKFIRQDAQPFFEYWQDIRDFLPFLESEDDHFIANKLFSGSGVHKKLIIWWLCSHPKYNEYKQKRITKIETMLEKNNGDSSLVKSLKDFNNFFKRLEKTAPLYEWDDRYLIRKDGGAPT